MYANLLVIPAPDAEIRPDAIAKNKLPELEGRHFGNYTMPASEVIVRSDGTIRVKLDGNRNGSYAEDAGYVAINGGAQITASF